MSQCYFCKNASYQFCATCKKHLCGFCINKLHCKLSCNICQGQDLNFQKYYLHSACNTCIRSKLQFKKVIMAFDSIYIQQDLCEAILRSFPVFISQRIWISPLNQSQGSEYFIPQAISLGNSQQEVVFVFWPGDFSQNTIEMIKNGITNKNQLIFANRNTFLFYIFVPLFRQNFPQNQIPHKIGIIIKALQELARKGQILNMGEHLMKKLKNREQQQLVRMKKGLSQFANLKILFTPQRISTIVYSVKRDILDQSLLNWTVNSFQNIGLIPFISRIQDVLFNIFNIQVNQQEILYNYSLIGNRPLSYRNQSNGIQQTVLQLKFSMQSMEKQTRELRSIKRRKQAAFNKVYDQINPFLPPGIYQKAFYFKFMIKQYKNWKLSHLILCVQQKIQSSTIISHNKPKQSGFKIEQILGLIQLIMEGHPSMPINQLQKILTDMLGQINYPVQGIPDLISILRTSSDFIIQNNQLFIKDQIIQQNQCPICFDALNTQIFSFNCLHYFHLECLREFVQKKLDKYQIPTCPYCLTQKSPEEVKNLMSSNPKLKSPSKIKQEQKKKFQYKRQVKEEQKDQEIEGIQLTSSQLFLKELPGVMKCYTLKCKYHFQPAGAVEYTCPLCKQSYCLFCQQKKTECVCHLEMEVEESSVLKLECKCGTWHSFNLEQEYVICGCGSLTCTRCFKSGEECYC